MPDHPKAIGDRSEAHVLAALTEQFDTVLLPWGENQRYDFVVEGDGEFHRIQVKTGRLRGGAVRFNTCSTSYHHPGAARAGQGHHDYAGQAEYFAVHCSELRAVFLVPVEDVGGREASLRVEPARNGQRSGIRFAADYRIHPPG